MKKNEVIAVISVLVTMIVLRSIGFERIPSQITIFMLIATPIFVLWIILKYNKIVIQKRYTKITFIVFFITCYISAIAWIMDKYFHQYYNEYRVILIVLLSMSFIAMTVTAIVCKTLNDKEKNEKGKNKKYR